MNLIRFDQPELLWLLLLILPIVWLGMRSLATLDPVRRWTAIAVRCLVLVVLVLMLSGLQAVQRHTDLTVMAVVDQSESVRRFATPPPPPEASSEVSPGGSATNPNTPTDRNTEQWVRDYLRSASADKRGDDKLGLITYDARPTVRAMPRHAVVLDPGTVDQPVEGTDTAAAIRSAMALFPPDSGARLVLVSDGNETTGRGDAANSAGETSGGGASGGGDVLAAAREAAAAGIPIDVVPIHYNVRHEVMVDGVYAPAQARESQTLAVRVVLRATAPAAGTLQVIQDGTVVDFNGNAPGTGVPIREAEWSAPGNGPALGSESTTSEASGDSNQNTSTDAAEISGGGGGQFVLAKQVELPAGSAGPTRFQAVFEPDTPAQGQPAQDTMTGNNRAEAFTLVQGKGKILFVDNVGGDSGAILPQALAREGITLDIVGPSGLPTRMSRLQKYDAVVFQNVPAELVSGPQQRMLAKYVHDLGGGFVMLGGDKSFGAGGWTNTPIDDYVLPVTCQIPSQTVLPSGALAIVLDRSGSMASTVGGSGKTQQELAGEAAVLAHATLYPQDVISVIAFDSSATSIVDPQLNSDPAKVVNLIRSIQPGGGTNVYAGLEMAYHKLANLNTQDAAIKHVILLTDGDSNPPQPGGYVKLVGQMAKAHITLSTVGVGDARNGQLLQQLARMGGGQYHPVTNPTNLPQIFIKEARTIRKNLIKEKTFQPKLQNTGSPIMAGIGGVPELRGLVLTGARQDPRVFMPMLGPEGEPLFAHWQVGLGRSAAFTSDATNKWASPWLNWGGYADFWARTIRRVARPPASRAADLIATVHGDRLHIKLDAAGGLTREAAEGEEQTTGGGGEGFANFLQVRGAVVTPDGETRDVTLEQTGPGVYEAEVPANDAGNYIASLIVQDAGGGRHTVFGGASRKPGNELRTFASNDRVMREVARLTGGRVLDPASPQPAGLFARDRDFESRSIRPLWRTLLVWLVALFLLDVANRRVAWDLGASWAWVKERATLMAGARRSPDSGEEGSLSAWKKVRAGIASKTTPPREPQPAGASMAQAAPVQPSRKRKFDAAPGAAVSDDFAGAVGGASESDTTSAAARAARERRRDSQEDDGSTTSQLLSAKRRARRQYTDDDASNS